MIVTRRRRKPFPWKRFAAPAALAALLAAAFAIPASREWIAQGPPAPLWHAASPVVAPLSRPFDALAQERTISSQRGQIAALQQQLAGAREQLANAQRQASSLQSQLEAAQQDAAQAQDDANRRPPARTASDAQQNTSDLSTQVSADMRRTASVWGAMDAQAAARIVQQLPDDYVARIFSAMPADAVGAILEDVSPAYAARLTRERPELAR